MEWFLGFIIICVVIAIFAWNINEDKKLERKASLDKKIKVLPNRDNLKIVFGKSYQYAFVLDNVGKVIHYMDEKHAQKIPFYKILSVELLEDNNVVSSKSTTRTVGGALLGGALAGGAGMVVGGLSGNTTQKKDVLKVTVKIRIRDYSIPSLSITCFDKTGSTGTYEEEIKNAQEIVDYVSIIIDEVDRKEKRLQSAIQKTSGKSSVADELAKLASLKQQGILTDEEFRIQKVKLLSK